MGDEIMAPRELAEQVLAMRLPPKTDKQLQNLMDRNNDGRLNPQEHEELESPVEMSETISLMRAKALRFLGRQP